VAEHVLLKSGVTEQELFITIARPKLAPLIPERSKEWLISIFDAAQLIQIGERITICRNPKDDKFLELAVAGAAALLVTGDADLLSLSPFREIPIVTPYEYFQWGRR